MIYNDWTKNDSARYSNSMHVMFSDFTSFSVKDCCSYMNILRSHQNVCTIKYKQVETLTFMFWTVCLSYFEALTMKNTNTTQPRSKTTSMIEKEMFTDLSKTPAPMQSLVILVINSEQLVCGVTFLLNVCNVCSI